MWGIAFLKSTKLLSGQTGISVRVNLAQKPGGKFLMVGADAYPAAQKDHTESCLINGCCLYGAPVGVPCCVCSYIAISLPRSSVDAHWAFRLAAVVSSYMP